jgi:hypothetical protein
MLNVANEGTSGTGSTATRSRTARWGWGILLTLSGLLVLNGLLLYAIVATGPQEQTISIMQMGFGALAVMVAWEGFRGRSAWAWNATWVMVALLAALALHIRRIGDRPDVGLWYVFLTAIALAGQLLAWPRGRKSP